MQEIRKINIWKKQETGKTALHNLYRNTPIEELNLSVRSYNCLRRADCKTVGDIMDTIGSPEEGSGGLRKIRNLGQRSEAEIMQKLSELKESLPTVSEQAETNAQKVRLIIKPAKAKWDTDISEYHLSQHSMCQLEACGIRKVKDLYATSPGNEPGWYAVRELFMRM